MLCQASRVHLLAKRKLQLINQGMHWSACQTSLRQDLQRASAEMPGIEAAQVRERAQTKYL